MNKLTEDQKNSIHLKTKDIIEWNYILNTVTDPEMVQKILDKVNIIFEEIKMIEER